MRRAGPLALLALAAGCAADKGDSGVPSLVTNPVDTGDCTAVNTPAISEVVLENTGIATNEVGESLPTMAVRARASDKDGDLASYQIDAYYDAIVDGAVEQDPEQDYADSGTLNDQGPCSLVAATLSAKVFLGGRLAFDTLYEWGVIVTDDHGVSSAMAYASGYTPKADGSDGG